MARAAGLAAALLVLVGLLTIGCSAPDAATGDGGARARGAGEPPAAGRPHGRGDEPTTSGTATSATTATTRAGERPPPGLPVEPAVPDLPAGPVPLAVADGVRPFTGLDTADPFVAVDRGVPWAFTTNTGFGNVPATNGAAVGDALPELPGWATPGRTWAPAVARVAGGWVLAFTAHHAASGRQCIGVATAARVDGPYAARPDPLVCDLAGGGSIDPSFVRSDRGLRLLYKIDGNCCGLPTPLRSVPLDAAGTAVAGPAATLAVADQPWEQGLVEAPTMTHAGGRWLLLYSAARWDTAAYAVGAAWCDGPAGPCRKVGDPVLRTGGDLGGPGGLEVVPGAVAIDGSRLVAFHAWPGAATGDRGGITRQLYLGRLAVDGDRVTVVPVVVGAL